MYTAFYGLREKPFALSPDPRFLYLAESHREAFAHLLYGIDQGEGFIAVTGEVGTGKTTLCRTLLERLGSETAVAFLFNPSHSPQELLEAIAGEFEIDVAGRTRRELLDTLNAFLLEQKGEGRRVLLIIDEAQNLSAETLEQLRLLSNLETASEKLIQILLLGQPELDTKLDSPELRQLRQRIGVRWSLTPLLASETRSYVRHRLRVAAGVERDVFSEGALREIHRRTGGIPRVVNVLCDRSLLAGYGEKRINIDSRLVRRVAQEIPDTAAAGTRRASLRVRRRIALALAGSGAAAFAIATLYAMPSREVAVGEAVTPSVPEVLVASAPVAASRNADAAVPPEVSSRPPSVVGDVALPLSGDRVETPRVEGFLPALLDQLEPITSRQRALNAVLEVYSEETFAAPPLSVAEMLARLTQRGLSVLVLADADLETLRALNHPALVRLRTLNGAKRFVALTELEDSDATLYGVTLEREVEVPLDEFVQQWDGETFVVWRDFEPVPELIVPGAGGRAIEWLQGALSELGLYIGPPSGIFDPATLRGVRALQASRHLVADGAVGPRTKMVLYDLVGRYDVPRLVPGEAESS